MATLVWKYNGPRADGIAAHYAKHLTEFAAREGLEDAHVTCEGPEVTMTLREDDCEAVAKALRPHQIRPGA